MFKINICNFIFICTFAFVTSNSLLQVIRLCDKYDEECMINESKRVLKILTNGVSNDLTHLKPFEFSNLKYENDFVINLFDGYLNGLDTFKVTNIRPEWDDKKWILGGFFNKLELQSNCKIVGNVLDNYLNGNGSINIIMENVYLDGNFYVTYTKKEDKEIYVKNVEHILYLESNNVKFTFSNIFEDTEKEKEFNHYLNENVNTARKELVPIVGEVLKKYLQQFKRILGETYPYRKLFLNNN